MDEKEKPMEKIMEIKEVPREEVRNVKGQFVKGVSGHRLAKHRTLSETSQDIRGDFLRAFYKCGGLKGLSKWVKASPSNKRTFYQFVVTLLPKEANITGNITQDAPKIFIVQYNNKADSEYHHSEVVMDMNGKILKDKDSATPS